MINLTNDSSLSSDSLLQNMHLLADWFWECDEQFHYSKFEKFNDDSTVEEITGALNHKLMWSPEVFFPLNLDSKKLERVMGDGADFKGLLVGVTIEDQVFYVSLSGSAKRDEHSRIIGYFGFATVVSDLPSDFLMLRQFREAMDESGDPIYMVDVKTLKFIDVNATACTRMGYSREHILSLGPADLLKESPETVRIEYMGLIHSGGNGIKTESIAYTSGGVKMIAEMHRRAVKVGGRWVVISIARNITERKSAELANIRKSETYSALSAAEAAMVVAREQSTLFQNVCTAVIDNGKFSTMAIFGLDSTNNRVNYVAGSGVGVEALKQVSWVYDDVAAYGNSLLGRACSSGGPVVLGDSHEDLRGVASYGQASKFTPRSAVAIPFYRNKQFVGVTLFCALEEQKFDKEIVYILQRMMSNMVYSLDKLELQEAKQRDHDRFEYLANYDSLTELPNRKHFNEKLESAIESACQSGTRFALLFVDLDGFKAVNDSLGHEYGDALLQEVSARFSNCLRGNDCVARLGGDEFVVIAGNVRADSAWEVIAQKLLEEAARPVQYKGEQFSVSASIGIAIYSANGESSDSLLNRADAAMYEAKSAGKNQVRVS